MQIQCQIVLYLPDYHVNTHIVCSTEPLSILHFSVFVVSGCAVAYFLFSERVELFFNSILFGRKRDKLFCKLWIVFRLVRFANVLTPVSGLTYKLSLH
jgi:hypothetical protein